MISTWILRLPDSLYREILSFNLTPDKMQFAHVNRAIFGILGKEVREVRLEDDSVEQFFESEAFRTKLLSLLSNSYNQLSIKCRYYEIEEGKADCPSITCDCLCGSVDHFFQLFRPRFGQIGTLHLEGLIYETLNIDNQLPEIAQVINDSEMKLKKLTFSNYEFTQIPVIHGLLALSISSYIFNIHLSTNHWITKLKHLTLDSIQTVTDVSCLDGIYELTLSYCSGIKDISPLNNNHIIHIYLCNNITEYSKSFKHSKFIDIKLDHSDVPFLPISTDGFEDAIEIRMEAPNYQKLFFLNPVSFSKHLRILKISRCDKEFMIPADHSLRELEIIDCWSYKASHNIENIYRVRLETLKLTDLLGLGGERKHGNRVVEIVDCNKIKDFSTLRTCDKVTIEVCEEFRDASLLFGVKELTVIPSSTNLKNHLNLHGVHHLTLTDIPTNVVALQLPASLQSITLHVSNLQQEMHHLFYFCRVEPQIAKIVLHFNYSYNKSLLFAVEFQKQGLHALYSLEFLANERKVVLLKRSCE